MYNFALSFYVKVQFLHFGFMCEVQKMNEKNYKKRLNFQSQMISRQSNQIDVLKSKIEKLEQQLKEKDEIINSIEPMRREMTENIKEYKRLKNEYQKLVQELKQMKEIMNQTVYKGKWWLIKFLIK